MMKTARCVLSFAIFAAVSGASAGDRPTAEELLAAFQKSVEKLARVRIECTEIMPETKRGANGVYTSTTETTVIRDTSRWKVDERQRTTNLVDGVRTDSDIWVQTLVGSEIIQAQLIDPSPENPDQLPVVGAFRDDHANRIWNMLGMTRVLFGRIEGDGGQPLWTVMGDDTKLELLPEKETIAGLETYALKSRGKYGEHRVWLDPENGGLPRRIEVRKQIGNLFDDEQMGSRPVHEVRTKPQLGHPQAPPDRREISARIDNIQIEKKSDVFVIMAFDYEFRFTNVKSNEEVVRKRSCRVRAIDIDPKPWPEDIFRFDIKVPNGHRITLLKNAPLYFGRIISETEYEWNDGKLQRRAGK